MSPVRRSSCHHKSLSSCRIRSQGWKTCSRWGRSRSGRPGVAGCVHRWRRIRPQMCKCAIPWLSYERRESDEPVQCCGRGPLPLAGGIRSEYADEGIGEPPGCPTRATRGYAGPARPCPQWRHRPRGRNRPGQVRNAEEFGDVCQQCRDRCLGGNLDVHPSTHTIVDEKCESKDSNACSVWKLCDGVQSLLGTPL